VFKTIARRHRRDRDLPERAWTLGVLRAVLDGTFYDVMPREFHEEKDGPGGYVPLRDRAPSVRYNLCRMVVEDSVGMVFGEEHFPRVACTERELAASLNGLVQETKLPSVMTSAAISGSVGSVAILMRVLKGRVFWQVMDTECLTPEWDPEAPDTLKRVTELYKVRAPALKAQGYAVDDGNRWYWFQRSWDTEREIWYLPWPVTPTEKDPKPVGPQEDEKRTVAHNLGFVPIEWIRNLPGGSVTGAACDGACTFKPGIDTQIELEYQLSQAGRGLKYSSDPTLVVKEPAAPEGEYVKSGDNALVVSEKGDAKLLEIGGTAAEAVIAYAKFLREVALETMHGNRADPQRFSGAQSGRALEMMNYGLIGLAGHLRTSYGKGAMLRLLQMVLRASAKIAIKLSDDKTLPKASGARLALIWPDWYPLSPEERREQAQTLQILEGSGLMSQETAVGAVCDSYDVADHQAELARIRAEQAEEDKRLAAQGAKVTASEQIPT